MNTRPLGVLRTGLRLKWLRKRSIVEEEKTLVEFERGEGQKVVVRRTRFRGKYYLDFRQFFLSEDGKWLPTKKGVSLPWERRDALIEALEQEE